MLHKKRKLSTIFFCCYQTVEVLSPQQYEYGNNWTIFWLFIYLNVYSKIIMIGDLRKVTLQERVKNNNNQLYANIYNRLLSKPRLIHNLTTLVGFYTKWLFLRHHTNSMSAIPQMLAIQFWPNYKGFWDYSLEYCRCILAI